LAAPAAPGRVLKLGRAPAKEGDPLDQRKEEAMAVCTTPWVRAAVRLALAGVLAAAVGCGRQPAEPQAQQAAPAAQPSPKKEPVPIDPRWQRPFAEATRADPPADWPPPPDVTITDKSVGKLYTDVVKAWDGVRFLSDDGK